MELVQAHFDFLLDHLLLVVFLAFLIEGAGIPFPSRIILLVAATLTTERRELAALAAVSAGGALIGDHVPYIAGALSGPRILAFYCRVTLGSEQCVEKTVRYFTRFGAAAILLSRFSTSVRLFAAALSGCGHIAYPRFLAFNVLGSILYAALLVTVGRLVGEPALQFLERPGRLRLLLLVGPLAAASLISYRIYRRWRYGVAKTASLRSGSACLVADEDAKRSR
jgi:membrane protein DedA with SNARE-associated domain